MGAQLSVVAHNKCGCARTCWFLELLICTPKWDFKIVASLDVLCIEKKKRSDKTKRKEKKRKEIKEVWI